jgi:hypothetical protein
MNPLSFSAQHELQDEIRAKWSNGGDSEGKMRPGWLLFLWYDTYVAVN